MVTMKQLEQSFKSKQASYQDELRQEVERLRLEVELAAKGIMIEDADVEVEQIPSSPTLVSQYVCV